MEISVMKFGGGDAGVIQVPDSFAAREYNSALVHQVVCANLANGREGNRAQKTRAEVSHTTRKLFRQKGSGRARGGMSSSPIRRGGGRAFPARPDENFKHKIPRRMFRAAMSVMFSQLLREGRVAAVKSLEMAAPKTREFAANLRAMNIDGPVLLVDTEIDKKIELSARNLPDVWYCPLRAMRPSYLTAQKIVITERAVNLMQEQWS
ncbi:MAG: 50S ribosomal protein L4 [Gammaproteobacteria bacterium]